jgi:branched-chain amino acid transport system ATP-binding protein
MKDLLKINNVSFKYGKMQVLEGVTLGVESNSIHGFVGANGAGKSTLLNIISGYLKADSGSVEFLGKDITGLKPIQRVTNGIARTFQKVELFDTLSVYDHVLLAVRQKEKIKKKRGSPLDIFRSFTASTKEAEVVEEILGAVGLEGVKNSPVASISLGLGRMVELARAVALEPKLILLDEPSSGLNTEETEIFVEIVKSLSDKLNLTIVIVEHDLTVINLLTDTLTVLESGKVLATGITDSVLNSDIVRTTYLGR